MTDYPRLAQSRAGTYQAAQAVIGQRIFGKPRPNLPPMTSVGTRRLSGRGQCAFLLALRFATVGRRQATLAHHAVAVGQDRLVF